jgi:multiple sugar transport system substrate-binding protein
MTREIELSIMASSIDPAGELGPVLAEFEAAQQVPVRVNVQVMNWDTAWVELVKMALYQHGPDISEVGLTWSVNLMAMDALRPYTAAECDSFGGAEAFVSSLWNSEVPAKSQVRWSIPWNAHTYVLCYRRDLLKRAGLDAAHAFDTITHVAETLAQLRASGIELPFIIPTAEVYVRDNLHVMASWVWGSGGHFISPDGRRVLFLSPEALAGISAYFRLYRYLPPAVQQLGIDDAYRLFLQGNAAMTIISAPHLSRYFHFHEVDVAPVVRENLATIPLPGVPYVGGSNLVIWKHVTADKLPAALKLVRYLTGRRAQSLFGQRSGIPPARLDALDDLIFVSEPFQAVAQALQTGRSYRSLARWGVVEEKLVAALAGIRSEVLAQPEIDLDHFIAQQLKPVARKLDMILEG